MHKKRVDETELRRRFNDGTYEQRVASGVLRADITGKSHVRQDGLPDNCSYCTNSLEHTYIDVQTNQVVAITHRYVRPDGTIGASGKPDPKLLVEGDIEYHLIQTKKRGPLTPKRHPAVKYASRKWRWLKYHFNALFNRFR